MPSVGPSPELHLISDRSTFILEIDVHDLEGIQPLVTFIAFEQTARCDNSQGAVRIPFFRDNGLVLVAS
jgi:hypothetical protein